MPSDSSLGNLMSNFCNSRVHYLKYCLAVRNGLLSYIVIFSPHLSKRYCQLNPYFGKKFAPVPCQLVLIKEQKSM